VRSVAFSPDGGVLASGSWDGTVLLWDIDAILYPNDQPNASFTWQVLSSSGTRLVVEPRTGDRIRFDASASSDPDGDIVEYAWDWTADGEFDTTSDKLIVEHAFNTSGTHCVTLRVTDNGGLTAEATETVTIGERVPPVAGFDISPLKPSVLDEITFIDTSTDADGRVLAWKWDFGNGVSSTDQYPTYEYTEPGTYTVHLTVTDNDGATASYERLVTVEALAEIVEPVEVWALVIGISDYDEVNDLRYARADAEAFTRWLLDAGVDHDHIVLLLDEKTEHAELGGMNSELATLSKVRAGLGWLRRYARPDDLVFVFFAGHGFQFNDDNGDEEDGVDEFLVLVDTMNDAKEETSLRDDEFGRFLDRIESKHVLVLFDSCYSAGQGRSLSSGARPLPGTFDLFSDFSLEGKLVFAAAREDQEALEDPGLGHGLFTYFLLEGLKGEADLDSDFLITAEELRSYVAEEVERYAREQLGGVQNPEMTGRGTPGIVVSRTNRPPDVAFTVGPDIPYAYGPTRFTDRSCDDTGIRAWSWDFGDGTPSSETNPAHVYEQAGTYTVTLTVTDSEGETATLEQEIVIAPPGEVTVISGDTIILSLGSANGLQVGDRFEVLRILQFADGTMVTERKAIIEVSEILDVDRSGCRIVELQRAIEPGDVVRYEE
jgi:PKD repeat protein